MDSDVQSSGALPIPTVSSEDSLAILLEKLEDYIEHSIQFTCTFEEFRHPQRYRSLSALVKYLADEIRNKQVICAVLALKSHFDNLETDDEPSVNQTRAIACEYIAWRLVLQLSEWECIDCLLGEIDLDPQSNSHEIDEEFAPLLETQIESGGITSSYEHGSLPTLQQTGTDQSQIPSLEDSVDQNVPSFRTQSFVSSFRGLNALEIAAVVGAKKFLSQVVLQRLITQIWKGEVVFWERLDIDSIKEAKIYNPRRADPFCRLRVPQYLKFFESIYFVSFLALYYAVLIPIQRNGRPPKYDHPPPPVDGYQGLDSSQHSSTQLLSITVPEVLLYVWIAGFAYDEFGEYLDAGQAFYAADFWSLWDLGIVAIGLGFFICRMVGLAQSSEEIIGISFDILSLEALFLVPRIFAILSLNSYYGTLIPCLREMTKDFLKFLSLVAILYLGFLTTFTLLARDNFSLREMSWVLVKVFFGSSYLGFDIAEKISPLLGPPLMLIFVCLTNILLITSLISLLSASLAKVLEHAREEYLFIYSVYVLEASTSNRLTYFLPPLNLISLFLRPLRLFTPPDQLRRTRILILKITHAPYVGAIWIYEGLWEILMGVKGGRGSSASSLKGPSTSMRLVRRGGTEYTKSPLATPKRRQNQRETDKRQATKTNTVASATEAAGFGLGSPLQSDRDNTNLLLRTLLAKVERLTSLVEEKQENI